MTELQPWSTVADAISFAGERVEHDPDPLNDRELADGRRYVLRVLRAVSETSLIDLDFDRPEFLTMHESVRHLGAAGPDIDYDVAILIPGVPYRITGRRGEASYVGIVVYGAGGASGAPSILTSVDVDDLVRMADGEDGSDTFSFLVDDPGAARVIVRQYFHDRSTQTAGSWEIERTDVARTAAAPPHSPDPGIVSHQIANGAETLRWNVGLNQLWTPERRDHPNEFIRLAADEIVAAVPNPDVTYSFTWWRIDEGEGLEISVTPPSTRYWAVQLCDRWFQCYPQRQTNLNDSQVRADDDGSVRIVLADSDPGSTNWLDTGGHRTGVVFFRWLHAEPETLPTCRVTPVGPAT